MDELLRDNIPGKRPSNPETPLSWPCHQDWAWSPEAQAVGGTVLARGFYTPGHLSQSTACNKFTKRALPRIEAPLSLTEQVVPKIESELD